MGATEIHELLFEPNGKIKNKNLPSEVFYKPAKVKVGRAITRKHRLDLNQGFIDEVVELEETETEPDRGRDNISKSKSTP